MAQKQSKASAVPDPEKAIPEALAAKERYKAQLQGWLEHYRATNLSSVEEAKTINVAGQAAMRAAMVMNGAAAIALLAYLGKCDAEPGLIPWAMLVYLAGVATAAIASGCGYLAMKASADLEDDDARRRAFAWRNNSAIVLVITAYSAFIGAGLIAFLHFKA